YAGSFRPADAMPRSRGSDDEPALERLPVDGLGVEGALTEGPPEAGTPGLGDGLADGRLGAGALAMPPDGPLGAPTLGDGVGERVLPGEALGAAVLAAASACRLQRSKSACVGDAVWA